MALTELIVKTGIHDAIAKKINQKGKLTNTGVAETIINNVRKTIIRNQLTDPKFYEEISKLFNDLIKQSREETEEYELFLKQAEELVKKMMKKHYSSEIPKELQGNIEATIIYNNLTTLNKTIFNLPESDADRAELAKKIDLTIKDNAPSGWRGDQARESQILNAIFPILEKDREATQSLFEIIKNQTGY